MTRSTFFEMRLLILNKQKVCQTQAEKISKLHMQKLRFHIVSNLLVYITTTVSKNY